MSAEDRARELGLDLSQRAGPVANYVPAVRSGSLVFLSGVLPVRPDGTRVTGQVGTVLDEKAGYEAARLAAIGLLARLRAEAGSLDRVRRIVKVTGFVNAPAGFTSQPAVVNGASDLLVEVFGEQGRHARSAIGVASLPLDAPVEVELIAELEP